MENQESDEPMQKKPHLLDSVSPTSMARNSSPSHPIAKSVDATVLQLQNQKLVQQLDLQKKHLYDIETKIQELQIYQTSYDDELISVNQLWNQLVDDLILLGVRAGANQEALKYLDIVDKKRGSVPPCAADEMFLCRLLQVDSLDTSNSDEVVRKVEEALALRHSSTMELMGLFENTIATQRAKAESISQNLHAVKSAEDATIQLSSINDLMKEEAKNLREMIDTLHVRHKEHTEQIQAYISSHSTDQSELKHLKGQLEEIKAELEENRRKLITLKMQKDAACEGHVTSPAIANGSLSPEKPIDKTKLRELKDSIDEIKIMAEGRLSELQAAQEYNLSLSRQCQDIENELKDDQHIYSSRLYSLINDRIHHWNAELDRYKILTEAIQAERSFVMRREKELNLRAESLEAANHKTTTVGSRIEVLEKKLQSCIVEKNGLELETEEAIQDSERQDIKSEFIAMASTLSKEMEMMEAQLKRWKDTAHDALYLREQSQSLRVSLSNKADEQKGLEDKCAKQMGEIKSLKALIEKLLKEKLELQNLASICTRECNDERGLAEIKESQRKAQAQAEELKNVLDEHFLELRVKAAHETETACQERLATAKAEIAELRTQLDLSEREVLELKEGIKVKEQEAEASIAEMETIGQAYEDMQTQNQHLLQQVAERDDYNIKLVSESVKTKHAYNSHLSEKQVMEKQLQQVNASVENFKARIAYSEEQMKGCFSEAYKLIQEDRHLAISLETTKWEVADADKEFRWLKSAVSSSEKEYEQISRRTNDIKLELDDERREKKKLEEELMELNKELEELGSESVEAAIVRLQEEVKNCKNILKCGVCFDRPKEVVIVKCYHLFCQQCIQRSLEIRHRKCPGCGTAFGQNDVRLVKM
ncbi:Zinc finger RING-type [Arabidopsis suecica]|uniref:E3 ubiquitin protein ligase n=1 Tax=Arabidopsis suecica TaxID=45249 RepID=A0A8T2CM48_ARASU|nr:Zinc finger RING-type [Arabidopsis suecica]